MHTQCRTPIDHDLNGSPSGYPPRPVKHCASIRNSAAAGELLEAPLMHVRRWPPVPLPLVDEPVVYLLRVQPRRLCQGMLLQFLKCTAPIRCSEKKKRNQHTRTDG
jgi:hypothetical protein